jgi:CRP-like cAMP-binding protein
MLEEFWSETARLMDLAADCRSTIAQSRTVVDHSWSVIREISKSMLADPILTSAFEYAPQDIRETEPEQALVAPSVKQVAAFAPSPNAARPALVNRLLTELPPDALDLIMSKATRVKLKRGQVLEQPRMPVPFAYFLESGIVSLQAVSRGNSWLASGLVGSDGMTGLPIILRSMKAPLKAQVHIAGEAWRIAADDLQSCLENSSSLLSLLLSYVQTMLVQSAYVGLCGARHTARQRIRSWLLLAAAALDDDEIIVTHQGVARLLALRRATVSDCLAELQRSKSIRQTRGCIEVLDAAKIADEACECHRIISAEFKRLWIRPSTGTSDDTRRTAGSLASGETPPRATPPGAI